MSDATRCRAMPRIKSGHGSGLGDDAVAVEGAPVTTVVAFSQKQSHGSYSVVNTNEQIGQTPIASALGLTSIEFDC
jgi:hypothetical protein